MGDQSDSLVSHTYYCHMCHTTMLTRVICHRHISNVIFVPLISSLRQATIVTCVRLSDIVVVIVGVEAVENVELF